MAKIKHGGSRLSKCSKRNCTIFTALAFVGYALGTLYIVYALWPKSQEERKKIGRLELANSTSLFAPYKDVDVEVWGKAAIGLYFWKHVLEGPLVNKMGGVWSYGVKSIGPFRFKFRTGPGVVPDKVPQKTKHLVLVLNGRVPNKVEFAKAWLDSLRNFHNLKNVVVVLLGNEQCNNDWLMGYMASRGGLVKLAFIVYDIPNRDDSVFFQWPLGVATYRKFPNIKPFTVEIEKPRKYICNFLGTIYKNSSRVFLKKIIDVFMLDKVCYFHYREKWLPKESTGSKHEYYNALANSDITLCPVGINTECYRIYEACSYGSVPVIEDVMTPGHCGKEGGTSPLFILKKYKAPFIFIKNWAELPKVIEKEKLMSQYELADRRKMIIDWYKKFKDQIRLHFVQTLIKKFDVSP
jgi:hypothetical protein